MDALLALFVNPALLLAAGGAAVPVALHLIHRRRARTVQFSSLKFLHAGVRRTAHRRRLEELLLLAMRVLLVALLALALARPFLGAGGASGRGDCSAVLVLDDSASMTCEHDGQSRFEAARAAAGRVLAGLRDGDLVRLRLASGRSPAGSPGLTSDRAAVAEDLARSRPTLARGNLAAEIVAGLEELGAKTDPSRELYVFSDLQRTALRGLAAQLSRARERRISVVLVDVSRPDFRNAAVTGAALRSRTRAAGQDAAVHAEVRNTGPAPTAAAVRLYVGDRQVAEQHLELDPASTVTVSLPCRLPETGELSGRVEISAAGDSMPFDNVRHFRAEVRPRVAVLVVEEPPRGAAPAGPPGSFYLVRALDPLGGAGPIGPRLAVPGEAARLLGPEFGAAVLSGLERIPPELAARLRDFVAAGGGLIVFPAAEPDRSSYAAAFGDRGDGLGAMLAAELGPALAGAAPEAAPGGAGEGPAVDGLDLTHPAMLQFKGLARTGFRDVRVRRGLTLVVPEKSRDPELMTLEQGRPFLVGRQFGKGGTYLFACPADAASSSLPLRRSFVPLLQEMVYGLAERSGRRGEYPVGARAALGFPRSRPPVRLRVTWPGQAGQTVELECSGPENSCAVGPLDEPGMYECQLLPDGERFAIAANPDPEESDLTPAGRGELAGLFAGFRHLEFCAGPDGVDRSVARVRGGRDLSAPALGLLLALAVLECFFGNWMVRGRARAAGPEGAPR